MVGSVHLETSGGVAGGRATSKEGVLTEAGYEILQIIEQIEVAKEKEKLLTPLNPSKSDVDGIVKKYCLAHRDKDRATVKLIVQAEVGAFINLGLVQANDSAHDTFKKTPQGEFSLTDKAKERMAEHEEKLAAEAAEAERLAQLPPEDPLKLTDMHFKILETTQFYVEAKPPHGTVKAYIIRRTLNDNGSLTNEANAAFATLREQGCFNEYQQFDHNSTRFRLSAHGKQILKNKPDRLPERSETPVLK